MLSVGLVGDFDDAVTAHQAIPLALALAGRAVGVSVAPAWIPTDTIRHGDDLASFDAVWCVPASPYRSMEGALRAIEFARTNHRPFLGTCGGFQHAVVEYARNVIGWENADHGETASEAERLVVTPLACALVEASAAIVLRPHTRLAAAYGTSEIVEQYRCRFGVNPAFHDALFGGSLRVAAVDGAGEVRAIELDGHPFFVATLFQPERAALSGTVPPIVQAFVSAARMRRQTA